MGHLVNPISFRLSVNSFWSSNWVLLNNFNYINIFKKDYLLFNYFDWLFNRSEIWTKNLLYSGYKIYRMYKKIIINVYYYDANAQIPKHNRLRFLAWLTRHFLRKALKKFKKKNWKRKILRRKSWNRFFDSLYNKFIKIEFLLLRNKFRFFQLNVLNKNNNYDSMSLNFYSTDNLSIPVTSIANYIGFRLRRKYSLGWTLRPVIRDLNYKILKKKLVGYKILCSGRFTRAQIATHEWQHRGAICYSTVTSLVKYAEVRVRLKFGIGGVKVWLGFGNNNIALRRRRVFIDAPKYIPFKYSLRVFINTKNNYITLHLNYWFFFFVRVLFLKTKNFELYRLCARRKIKILLYFLFKKGKHAIFSYYNVIKSRYKKKYHSIFYNRLIFYRILDYIKYKDFLVKKKIKELEEREYIKELCLAYEDFDAYLELQEHKKTEKYKMEQEEKLRIRTKRIKKDRLKLIKKLSKRYKKRRRYQHYIETSDRNLPCFSLLLVKNSKLIITFNTKRLKDSLLNNINLISTVLEQDLLKKFIN